MFSIVIVFDFHLCECYEIRYFYFDLCDSKKENVDEKLEIEIIRIVSEIFRDDKKLSQIMRLQRREFVTDFVECFERDHWQTIIQMALHF